MYQPVASLWFQNITVGMISETGSECQLRVMETAPMYINLRITVRE